jgi:hypothetical protein
MQRIASKPGRGAAWADESISLLRQKGVYGPDEAIWQPGMKPEVAAQRLESVAESYGQTIGESRRFAHQLLANGGDEFLPDPTRIPDLLYGTAEKKGPLYDLIRVRQLGGTVPEDRMKLLTQIEEYAGDLGGSGKRWELETAYDDLASLREYVYPKSGTAAPEWTKAHAIIKKEVEAATLQALRSRAGGVEAYEKAVKSYSLLADVAKASEFAALTQTGDALLAKAAAFTLNSMVWSAGSGASLGRALQVGAQRGALLTATAAAFRRAQVYTATEARITQLGGIHKRLQEAANRTEKAIDVYMQSTKRKMLVPTSVNFWNKLTDKSDRREAVKAASGKLSELFANPDALADEITAGIGDLQDAAPRTALAAGETHARALQFLQQKAWTPKATLQPLIDKQLPSESETARFERYGAAVQDPYGELEAMATGLPMSQEAAEVFQAVYPGLKRAFGIQLLETITNSTTPLTTAQRNILARFLGPEVDPIYNPEFIAQLQEVYREPAAKGPGRPQGLSDTRKDGTVQGLAPSSQKVQRNLAEV